MAGARPRGRTMHLEVVGKSSYLAGPRAFSPQRIGPATTLEGSSAQGRFHPLQAIGPRSDPTTSRCTGGRSRSSDDAQRRDPSPRHPGTATFESTRDTRPAATDFRALSDRETKYSIAVEAHGVHQPSSTNRPNKLVARERADCAPRRLPFSHPLASWHEGHHRGLLRRRHMRVAGNRAAPGDEPAVERGCPHPGRSRLRHAGRCGVYELALAEPTGAQRHLLISGAPPNLGSTTSGRADQSPAA